MDNRIVYFGNQRCALYSGANRCTLPPYDARVEYLEVDDNANTFIDTGILPSNSISFVARIQVLEGYDGFIFEGGKEAQVNEIGFFLKTGQGKVDFRFGNKVSSVFYTFPTEPFLISSFDNPNVLVVNGTDFSVTSPTFLTNYLYSIYLFGQHRINTSSGSAKNCRVYYFKMYNSGTLVRSFIPVRNGNVGYMYDTVSGKLLGNSGTGNFILGPDITD